MKKKGSNIEFLVARDRELHRHFIDILQNSVGVPLRDMFGMAARRPCSRFWVSEVHATEVIAAMLRGERPLRQLPKRAEMYDELLRRVVEWRRIHPGHPLSDAVFACVNSPAPEFYLTDKSARVIIYNIRARRHGANDR